MPQREQSKKTKTKTARVGGQRVTRRATATAAKTRARSSARGRVSRASKPTTAYELCERVCEHILEEPRRYYQGVWIVRGKDNIRREVNDEPPCGTLACRAGWIVALYDGPQTAFRMERADMWQPKIANRANEILGVDRDATRWLFDGGSVCSVSLKTGTPDYVAEGARGLREFMAKHEVHLKSRLLKDVPKPEVTR